MGDIRERAHRGAYMRAYEDTINVPVKPWAPWYASPADNKRYMRLTVARTIAAALQKLDPHYPQPDAEVADNHDTMRKRLQDDLR